MTSNNRQQSNARRRRSARHAVVVGAARSSCDDRHQIWLRYGAVRCVHRARRRRRDRAPASCRCARSRAKAITTIEGLSHGPQSPACSGPGSSSMCRSAATVSPGRSCRPRRCSIAIPRPATPTSTPRWPAIFAAAAPIREFAQAIHRAAEHADERHRRIAILSAPSIDLGRRDFCKRSRGGRRPGAGHDAARPRRPIAAASAGRGRRQLNAWLKIARG